ncbi:LysR family transcriptional regulator [Zooshikella marina]|uniref:LysR family transcriptional regulator n=1 Tax=Zooshikella ganghwensis TaxID=202772 RepID=UPI00047FC60C|nr:LysR family transcriptional regulator [Zooshikella ganghwensis]MBU2708060.1 LysR family transcriptional regulator [Zooshikella ganghwensis]
MTSRLHAHIGTIRQLEIFLAVYEGGSITAASEMLYLTQPTVSMQIKKLAETIDMPLYEQIGRKLVFTDAGHALATTAKDVLNSFIDLETKLSDLRGLKAGTLKIAVVTTSQYFIPHLLGPFCERYPAIDIQLKVANRQQVIDRLSAGMDDFYVFSHLPEDIEMETIEFLPNPLVAIAPQNHPLTAKKRIHLETISDAPFLMREKGSGTRFAIEEFMKEHQIQLNLKMTIESNEAIKHAVMSGLGISILSAHTLAFGGRAGLVELAIKPLPIKTHWYFAWLKGKQLSIIANTFLNYVQSEGKETLLSELRQEQLDV